MGVEGRPPPSAPSDRPVPRAWPVSAPTAPSSAAPPSASPSGTVGPSGAHSAGHRGPGRVVWTIAVLSALVLLVAGGVVAVTALAGRGSLPLPAFASARNGARSTGVATALGGLTAGLRAHDEAKFLADVNPRDGGLVTRERSFFRGMIALPLRDATISWDGASVREPSGTSVRPAGAVTVVADLRYLLDGWDDETVDDALVLTLAPAGGRWLVVGDAESAGGSTTHRYDEPWTVGARLVVARRAHVLVVGEIARRTDVERLADHLEDVVGDVRATWPEPSWNGRVVAYALTDQRFVQAWFGTQAATGPPSDRPDAVPTWEARVGNLPRASAGDQTPQGPARLVVTPYVLRRTDTRVLSTLRHEVTHVATARTGRPVPGWLAEGAAEYTGFRLGGARVDALRTFVQHGLTVVADRQLRAGTWTPRLVDDRDAFYTGTAGTVGAGYLDSWIACLYVADRYGDAGLRRLYDAAAAQPSTEGLDAVNAGALRSALQTDPAAFQDAVRAYGVALYRRATGG